MTFLKQKGVVLVCTLGSLILTGCSGPLYKPGMVSKGKGYSGTLEAATEKRQAYWQVEKGVELYHFAHGQGKKVLVIHGGPGFPSQSPWLGLESLSKEHQFVYYHQRGCGKSTRPIDTFNSKNFYKNMLKLDQALGLGSQIADIERIRKKLGEEKLILLGHSFGGFIASLYAAEFPDHVEKLILVTPADVVKMPHKDEGHDGLYSAVREKLNDEQKKEFDDFMLRYFDYKTIFDKSEAELEALNNEFGKYFIMVANVSGKQLPEVKPGEGNGWLTTALFFSMGRKHDYTKALKKISAPTLIFYGEEDLIPISSISDYRDHIPDNQLVKIKGAGHAVFDDQPKAFSKTLSVFLGKGE